MAKIEELSAQKLVSQLIQKLYPGLSEIVESIRQIILDTDKYLSKLNGTGQVSITMVK